MTEDAARPPTTAPKTARGTPFRAYATIRACETQSAKLAATNAQKKIERAYKPVRRLTRSFAFRAFVRNTYRSVPNEAPQTARTDSESGESQYVCSASPTSSIGLAIPFLLDATLFDLGPQRGQLRLRQGPRIIEQIRHRFAAKRIDDAIDHRRHRPAVRASLLDPVIHLLLTFLPDRDEVLVDQAIESRRDTGVRNVSRPTGLLVDRSGSRGSEISNGPQDRQLKLAKFHSFDYKDSNLVKSCPIADYFACLLGECRCLGCEFGEPLGQDVERCQQDRLRAQRSIRLELHDDPRRVVRGLHRIDLVLIHELLAGLTVRRELEGLFLLRRRGLHVAFAERDIRIERVQRLAAGLQDRIVPVSHAVRRLPFRVVLPRAQDRGRVDQHRLPVPELDDRDLRVFRSQLRVSNRLQVRGRDDAGATLVHGVDDRAVRASFPVAGRSVFPAVVLRKF